jgi:hypothetical protein
MVSLQVVVTRHCFLGLLGHATRGRRRRAAGRLGCLLQTSGGSAGLLPPPAAPPTTGARGCWGQRSAQLPCFSTHTYIAPASPVLTPHSAPLRSVGDLCAAHVHAWRLCPLCFCMRRHSCGPPAWLCMWRAPPPWGLGGLCCPTNACWPPCGSHSVLIMRRGCVSERVISRAGPVLGPGCPPGGGWGGCVMCPWPTATVSCWVVRAAQAC